MEFNEKTLSKEVIYSGKIVHLEKHIVELQNGNQAIREIIHHQGAVAVMAINEAKELIFVRQYRKAIEQACVEIPAGLIEDGEDPLLAAQRELEEETGFKAENWKEITTFFISPGYNDEYVKIYLASGLSEVENPLAQDEDEHLEAFSIDYLEASQLVEKGEISDAKTIYAMLYWQQLLAEKDD